MSHNPRPTRLSFDEFKLFYESTEKVTDRRLGTNRWNYSICVAIIVAVAAITRWSLTSPNLFGFGLAADLVLCLMAILYCALWVGQIRDFKKLNNAKFAVLSEMAPNIEFDPTKPGEIVSYCPFDKEWKKLNELNALDEVGQSNIIALKSSNIEYFIPKAFAALFVGIIIMLVIAIFTNWPTFRTSQEAPKSSSSAPAQGQKP